MTNQKKPTQLLTLLIFILLLAACGGEDETPTPENSPTEAVAAVTNTPPLPTETDTPEPTVIPTQTPTPIPTETPEPTPPPTPTPSPLEIAQSATVKIVIEGSEYLEKLIGSGTGILYDTSGLVLTSNHLVDGAGLIQVLVEGQEGSLSAQILGRSACDDLAVLQLLGNEFPAVVFHESDSVSETLQIIGYPLGNSTPIIEESRQDEETNQLSAGFADITGTIQLDTAFDPGFSGAPVLTGNGLVMGLMVYAGSESDHAAILPMTQIEPILVELESGTNLNWIGINAGPISAETAALVGIEPTPGLFIYAVDFRGPGGQADLRNGDFITEIGGIDVTGEDGIESYCNLLRQLPENENEPLDIAVIRNNSRYIGQIFGDPLAEEVVVVETTPDETTPSQPAGGDTGASLLASLQNTKFELQSVGGTIDSLANNGCLTPQLASANIGGPGFFAPDEETLAHPGCIHSITDCENILASYGRINNPSPVDLTNADQLLINASNSHQTAISTFEAGASNLVEACQAFVADPSLSIGPLAFGLARQGVNDALNILNPAIQQLQGQ